MSDYTFKTSLCADGEDFDDCEVLMWLEPADPDVGYFRECAEVQTVTCNGVDITDRLSESNKDDLCVEVYEHIESDMCGAADYEYECRRDARLGL